MSLAHQSIATINSPEFINLQPMDINPLMSSCQIKVFYLGKNRNGSYISKEVATEMAKTLRGAPIVGYYKDSKEDFADHGEKITFDDEGVHFDCMTKPYGFVAPDAKVWFKDFEDMDEFGNSVIHTYMMTTGYLWTGQFAEAQDVVDNGRPHSMELDEKSLQGHWSSDIKENMDFFIINDAIFSKLCILGDDVEPCFEGSAVTAPEVSTSFTLDDNFKQSLFKMMEELKYALKGGSTVADVKKKNVNVNETPEADEKEPVTEFTQDSSAENEAATDFVDKKDEEEKEDPKQNESASDEKKPEEEEEKKKYEKADPEEDEKKKEEKFEKSSDDEKEKEDASDDKEDVEEEKKEDEEKKKFSLLEEKYEELKSSYTSLENELKELREFKSNVESKEKDDLIAQFYMLSEEDKKDVIENKANYSLEDIKSKLAVICFEKKVNFNLEGSSENKESMKETEKSVTTYNVNNEDSTPDWIKAVEETMNSNY